MSWPVERLLLGRLSCERVLWTASFCQRWVWNAGAAAAKRCSYIFNHPLVRLWIELPRLHFTLNDMFFELCYAVWWAVSIAWLCQLILFCSVLQGHFSCFTFFRPEYFNLFRDKRILLMQRFLCCLGTWSSSVIIDEFLWIMEVRCGSISGPIVTVDELGKVFFYQTCLVDHWEIQNCTRLDMLCFLLGTAISFRWIGRCNSNSRWCLLNHLRLLTLRVTLISWLLGLILEHWVLWSPCTLVVEWDTAAVVSFVWLLSVIFWFQLFLSFQVLLLSNGTDYVFAKESLVSRACFIITLKLCIGQFTLWNALTVVWVAESFEPIRKRLIGASLIHLIITRRHVWHLHRDDVATFRLPLLLFGLSELMIHQCFRIELLKVYNWCLVKGRLNSFLCILVVNFDLSRLLFSIFLPRPEVSCCWYAWLIESCLYPFTLCPAFKDAVITAGSSPKFNLIMPPFCAYFVVLKAINSLVPVSFRFCRSLNWWFLTSICNFAAPCYAS